MEFVPTLLANPSHVRGPLKPCPAAVVWSLLAVISTQEQQLQVLHLLFGPETDTQGGWVPALIGSCL